MTRLPTLLDAEVAKTMQSRDPANQQNVASQNVVPHDLAVRLRDPVDRATKVPNEESRPQTDGREAQLSTEAKARNALLDRLGLRRSSDGTLQLKDQMTLQQLPGLGPQGPARLSDALPDIQTLAALPPPPVADQSMNPQALSAFSDALGRSIDDVLLTANSYPSMMDSVAMDSLTAVFMKLNIDNPLDTTEMQNQLEEALHEMRELQVQNVKKKLQELDKMLKEAMASAMSGFFMAAIMAAIVAAIIAAILIGILAAIIVAIIVMVVMMIVKQQIESMMQKAAAEARQQAQQMAAQAIQQIDQGIEAERQKRLAEIASLSLVGPDGEPLTSESMKASLRPPLIDALKKIANILDTEGAGAAEAQGPDIIHDAMYDELLALGIPEDKADAMAWAIAAETMTNLATKYGRKDDTTDDDGVVDPTPLPGEDPGRHPGETINPNNTPVVATDNVPATAVPPVTVVDVDIDLGDGGPPGRHPSDTLGMGVGSLTALSESNQALTALLGSSIVKEGQAIALKRVPAETIDRISESLATRGIEATLRDEAMREQTIAPSTMLGMGAILYGSLPADQLAGNLQDDIDAKQIIAQIAAAKDRALEALLTVGNEARLATEQIQRTTNV